MKKIPSSEGKLIGEITHFFGKIKVGVIKLKSPLKEGDTIRVVGGEETDLVTAVRDDPAGGTASPPPRGAGDP